MIDSITVTVNARSLTLTGMDISLLVNGATERAESVLKTVLLTSGAGFIGTLHQGGSYTVDDVIATVTPVATLQHKLLGKSREGLDKWLQDLRASLVAKSKTVTFCNWCPDPRNPSPEHHPGGQAIHIPISDDDREAIAPGDERYYRTPGASDK